ncbi:MAG: endopeptidase La [Oscillospiraceae bacterium]|nr:endopeptidase La [Oscillospiraceae bacterium]
MAVKVKVKIDKNTNIVPMPAIALRGLVVFPNNVIHFEVGREKSIAAVEWAMEHNTPVFLIAQRDMDMENPTRNDLFAYGVVAEVKQLLRISDTLVKVLVEGKYRAKLLELETEGSFLSATTKAAPLRGLRNANTENIEALVRSIKNAFQYYITLNTRLPKDVAYNILTSDNAQFLSEYVPSNILFKYQDKQLILDENTLQGRLEKLVELFNKENKIITIEKEIQEKVTDNLDKNQRDYYFREQIRVMSEELDDYDDTRHETEIYREKLENLHLDKEIEEKLNKEIDRLAKMQGSAQEASVIRTYLDTCLELPWNVITKDNLDIKKAESILNKDHYGLTKVKERILELLAVRKLSADVKGQIICLVGPPGVGKTSIARSIAACLGREYARMSLGGVRDEAEIRGHRRTYIGAMPGKIISAMQTAKTRNPLILMDEIDKMANDFRGDPAAALLEALDPEQNSTFKDHYLDIPFDLSEVLFITTANSLDTIPRPLRDRMDIIELPSYTRIEKFNIAKKHLVPKQLDKNGLKAHVKFSSAGIYGLIDGYTAEAGVRGLERAITEVLRKCAKQVAAQEIETITITAVGLEKILGPKRVKPAFFNRTDAIGIANGLAWTSIGGEILPIEVQLIPGGSGKLEITGSLGDVMVESAKLALTYAKVHAEEYGYSADVFKNLDIHIHAPEGAVPKDGPSAGITLATALISSLSGLAVRGDVAMTGEITLHGKVLPIGGLKEKSMAAYREGMKLVLIPKDNVADLYEVDEVVKETIKFVPVSTIQEALEINLIKTKKQKKDYATAPMPPQAAKKPSATVVQ